MKAEHLDSIIEERILELVGELTEHNPAELNKEMSFEADLGLDSIRTIRLSTSLPDLFPEYEDADWGAELSPQQMPEILTIGEFIEEIKRCLAAEEEDVEPEIAGEAQQGEAQQGEAEQLEKPHEPEMIEIELVEDQYLFLIVHMAFFSTTSLCSRMRLKGPMNVDAMKKTWGDLLQRHPMLRASFSLPTGAKTLQEYRLHILKNPVPPEVSVRDLRNIKLKEQERILEEEAMKWKAYEWDFLTWPLHSFVVFQLDDSLFEIFLVDTHLIADGISNQIIMREFV
ncbi:MAG: hypothetical protein GY792_04965, partial [Gammaproteobacteria bacterium]|nr:hypothetical protein [Gammaproteobacteria bacterium]